MTPNSRRKFLQAASLSIGGLSASTFIFPSKAEAATPQPTLARKTVYLWDENSKNNGPDPTKRPKMEFFIPEGGGTQKRAAILVCPGGGYGGLAPHEGAPFAEFFASKGIVSAVLTYRVSPNRYPAPYGDAVRAMRLFRSQAESLGVDPAKIGIMGFSAGGHLASTVATQPDLYKEPEDDLVNKISARPDRAILGYPVISFEEFAHLGSVKNLLGEKPNPDLMRQLSNHQQVNAQTPPTFLFHTADDSVVAVQNSFFFAEACARHSVPLALHIYPSGRHGVGLALDNPELKDWSTVLLRWLDDWLPASTK
ncbi:alpha/beta hydrolase [Tellurirhabdus bombi]|uniref:alpha/beta hydrolase n=1 Tax=Tellurirhabdus bombi TaxID=2907205 RepID=UPI001F39C8D2|nr:alpha/beta hydrolase [Tellurirhabdus bombi]